MLGRLAKWLRILGYDTFYFNDVTPQDLIKTVLSDGRVLLTRNHRISEKKGIRMLLIKSENFEEQMKEVIERFELKSGNFLTRCPCCNTILDMVTKESVQGKVPPFVYSSYDEFAICGKCDKYFWKGTHLSDMIERVKKICKKETK